MTKTVTTYCRICLANCGIDVTVDEKANRVLEIGPDRANPYTWRDFCRKGMTGGEVATHPRRITRPMRRVADGSYEEATYEEAIADIAGRLNAIIDRDGPQAVGSYHGNPMGFTFATTLCFTALLDAIGTANRFYVGSVDQNNWHIVGDKMYGNPFTALIPHIDECDCFVLVGMDPVHSRFNWVENNPAGWDRVLERQAAGADLIVVDPRRSDTADKADTHLAVLPGTDWALLLGMLHVIVARGWDHPSTTLPMTGVEEIRSLALEQDLGQLAQRCGLTADAIEDVARRFATARTAMVITRTGVSQTLFGTVGEWLSHVLNAMTDRLDTPGGRRYERGYVDIALVFKTMEANGTDHRTRLRDLPTVLGMHSIAELPDEITTPGEGQIKGLLMAFGNPVVSGPNGAALDEALSQLEFLVACDLVQRESHRHADWLLPGTHWLERSEMNPLLGGLQDQPYVHYAQKALDPPEGVMEEWELFTNIALAMNRNLFGKPGVNRFVKLTRWLARVTRRPELAFNPEWVSRLLVRSGRRLKWKDIVAHEHGWIYGERRFGDLRAGLATEDKKVHLAPEALVADLRRALREDHLPTTPEFPLLMTNRRHREGMNSNFNETPGLNLPRRENVLDVHPDDARAAGILDGDLVRLESAISSVEVRARITEVMRPGVVCLPHGWGGRVFDPAGGSAPLQFGANRNLLVDGTKLDALSQTPALNGTAVRLAQVRSEKSAVPNRLRSSS